MDNFSYMWAESIVAVCTIISIWTWIARHRSDEPPAPDQAPVDAKNTSRVLGPGAGKMVLSISRNSNA